MSQITPGYDFGQNEIPTKETLQLMTAGISITQIDISQIATALIGIKIANTSPSLPAEGWMRVSPAGGLYVTTRWGEVHLYRGCWGGMETRRYPVEASAGNAQRRVGFILTGMTTLTTSESAVFWSRVTPTNLNLFRYYKPLDTAPSLGVIGSPVPGDHPRFLLFGACVRDREGQGAFMTNPGLEGSAVTPSNDLIGNASAPFSGAYSSSGTVAGIGGCCGMLSWNYQASSIYWPTIAWNFPNMMRVV